MSIPVIIAARNEEQCVGYGLDALSKQTYCVEPIVVVNGSTDKTADIAKSYGATVLESPEGKMLAIQEGLRYLGKQALSAVLILDADSRPFTKGWCEHLSGELQSLPSPNPAIVWGPYVYRGEINPLLATLFTGATMRVSWADRHDELPRTIRGGNMGLLIKNEELLNDLLALDNYWPREDAAIFDTMKRHNANHKVTFNPNGWVFTSGYRVTETLRKAIKQRRHPSLAMDSSYASEAPQNSRPYNSATTATVRHENPLC